MPRNRRSQSPAIARDRAMRRVRMRRLNVIIPFRDRYDHLATLLPVLKRHLRTIPHRVIVVEQADQKPFNKGKILNAGAVLAPPCDYYCFHDVDLVPAWAPGKADAYGYTRSVAHLAARRLGHEGQRSVRSCPYCLGGVVLFDRATFHAVNGFSNEYWGWGQEDNDLYARAVLSGKHVSDRPRRYWSLPHAAPYRCNHPHWEANCARYERMRRGQADFQHDGLNTLSYTLVSHERYPECEWIAIQV
jgi:glycosyl transferase family 7 (putative galactosyltransferase)